jgi:hypothetical protein
MQATLGQYRWVLMSDMQPPTVTSGQSVDNIYTFLISSILIFSKELIQKCSGRAELEIQFDHFGSLYYIP